MDRNAKIIALRREGVGPREIARRLNLTPSLVAGVLHRAGMCSERRGRGWGYSLGFKRKVAAYGRVHGPVAAERHFGLGHSTGTRWMRQVPA